MRLDSGEVIVGEASAPNAQERSAEDNSLELQVSQLQEENQRLRDEIKALTIDVAARNRDIVFYQEAGNGQRQRAESAEALAAELQRKVDACEMMGTSGNVIVLSHEGRIDMLSKRVNELEALAAERQQEIEKRLAERDESDRAKILDGIIGRTLSALGADEHDSCDGLARTRMQEIAQLRMSANEWESRARFWEGRSQGVDAAVPYAERSNVGGSGRPCNEACQP